MKRVFVLFVKTFIYALSHYMWEILSYYFLLFIFIFGCFYSGFRKTIVGVFFIILFIAGFKILKKFMLKINDYFVQKYEQRRREKLKALYQYLKKQ